MRVLSVASECFPLAKTGGLADVVGALPGALAPHGVAVTTLMPGYTSVHGQFGEIEEIGRYPDLVGAPARLVRGSAGGLDLIVLDAPELFGRDGLYAEPGGVDWPDNWRRFAALARAAADLALGRTGEGFDLLHAHDWQMGLAPAYLRYAEGTQVPSVMTIHNLAFQGVFDAGVFGQLGLPPQAFDIDGVEHNGGVGYLKAGLRAASALTTVSPTYAEEIAQPAFGMGLDGLIRARRDRLVGIVNGIDTDVWNPETDARLAQTFSVRTIRRRATNRVAVEAAFGLAGDEGPLFCVVSRLAWQKGMDVLAEVADELVAMGGRLAVLGAGDAELERGLRAAAERHPGRIGVTFGYDETLSHLLQGGADAILIPSRFEPCGLTQLYGLRYGCVPVAARTGGLADTIIDANAAALQAGVATGFLFDGVEAGSLRRVLQRVMRTYADREAWRSLQGRGMRTDVSWRASGAAYARLYRSVVG